MNSASNSPSRQLLSEMNHATPVEQEQSSQGHCICGVEGSGNWIACDGEGCPIQWYHWECVGVTEEPVGDWMCPQCRGGTTAGKATVVKKEAPKSRKFQRLTRIVYETTEASIFENIVNESRAAALAIKDEAKAQEAAGGSDLEEQKAEPGEKSAERKLVRKIPAKAEGELEDARDDSSYDLTQAPDDIDIGEDSLIVGDGIEEPDEDAPLSIQEAAARLVFLGMEKPFSAVQDARGRETGQGVKFFDVFPPSGVVTGLFEISAERSTLPRLDD